VLLVDQIYDIDEPGLLQGRLPTATEVEAGAGKGSVG